jgi:trans-aconitate methyltransferase
MVEPRLDTTRAHPARRYDYWLGGKDNFAADRESGDMVAAQFPGIRIAVIENRKFLRRAVHLLAEQGVRQFLDIGAGLPTADNVHQVAQRVRPDARIVYVDNDPLVLTHARALLSSDPLGRTAYLDADLVQPEAILGDPVLRDTLDLEQPVALMLVAVLHFLADNDQAYSVVNTLVDALAPGSFLVISHATHDLMPAHVDQRLGSVPGRGSFTPRTRDQVARFGQGLELLEPGLTITSEWRPDPGADLPDPADVAAYAMVARKS